MEGGENPYKMVALKVDILLLLREKETFNPDYFPVQDLHGIFPHVDNDEIDAALDDLDENAAAPLNYYTEPNDVNVCLSNKRETNTFITHLKQKGHVEEQGLQHEEPSEGEAWFKK